MNISASSDWQTPDTLPRLAAGEVHVWRIALDEALPELDHVLQPDELARANRFRFAADRARYVVSRAALRRLLGGHLGMPATQVRFFYAAHGKPELAATHGSDLRFNVSHSGDLGLIAMTHGRAVGIDIENMRPDIECLEIAGRYFSAADIATLKAQAARELLPAFYDCWVKKEAVIKAWGVGLSLSLDSFTVPPDRDVASLSPPSDGLAALDVIALQTRQEYAAAIAVEGKGYTLRRWNQSVTDWKIS